MDEVKCVLTEATLEFDASVVRLGGHLDEGGTHPQARTRRKIGGRDVEIDQEVVAEQAEGLTVGNQLGHVAAHDCKLGLWIPRRPSAPTIARHSLVRGEAHAFWCLPDTVRTSPYDEGQTSGSDGRPRPTHEDQTRAEQADDDAGNRPLARMLPPEERSYSEISTQPLELRYPSPSSLGCVGIAPFVFPSLEARRGGVRPAPRGFSD